MSLGLVELCFQQQDNLSLHFYIPVRHSRDPHGFILPPGYTVECVAPTSQEDQTLTLYLHTAHAQWALVHSRLSWLCLCKHLNILAEETVKFGAGDIFVCFWITNLRFALSVGHKGCSCPPCRELHPLCWHSCTVRALLPTVTIMVLPRWTSCSCHC